MAALNSALCVLYIFLVYSRLPENLPAGVAVTVFALACATALASGRLWVIAKTRLGILFITFTVLLLVSGALGVWPGGSAVFLKDHWLRSFLVFFITAAAASSPKRSIRILMAMPLGVTFICLVSLYVGATYVGDRLVSPNLGGRFSNPNNLAIATVLATPLWLTAVSDSTRSWIVRITGAASVAALGVATVRTGSRAGLLALGAMTAFVIWRAPLASKVRTVLLAAVLIPVGVATVPKDIMTRFTTFAQSKRNSDAGLRAAGSTAVRLHMLEQSARLTLRHPFFGVGVGMFTVAENALAREQGQSRGSWNEAHNIYAQILVECGIPGLLLFLYIIRTVWTLLKEAERAALASGSARFASAAAFMQVAMVGYCVLGFFANYGYRDYLPVLCGLTVGIYESVRHHLHVVEKIRGHEDAAAPAGLRRPLPALRPA